MSAQVDQRAGQASPGQLRNMIETSAQAMVYPVSTSHLLGASTRRMEELAAQPRRLDFGLGAELATTFPYERILRG